MVLKHVHTAVPNEVIQSAFWNDNHVVDGNTGEVLFLTAGGNVSANSNLFWDNADKRLGIGTTTPDKTLSVAGDGVSAIFGQDITAGQHATIVIGQEDAANLSGNIDYDLNNNRMTFQIGGDALGSAITIIDGGNVGVNTLTPSQRFVTGTGTTSGLDPKTYIVATNDADVRMGACVNNQLTALQSTGSNYGGLFAYDYGAPAPLPLVLNYFGGNVGIGPDISPDYKLDVQGTFHADGIASFDSNVGIAGQLSITGASRVRVTKNDAQTIANLTTTIVEYDDEDFDNLGEFDAVTNNRFTALETGYYFVNARIRYELYAWIAGRYRFLYLYKNGVQYNVLDVIYVEANITNYLDIGGNALIYLEAGEYIDIRTRHNRGANTDISADAFYNYFEVHRLS